MQDTIIAKRVLQRKTRGGYLVATAQLHQLAGNRRPYFSVTAELWDSEGWYKNGQDARCRAGGCLHAEILAAFPELGPVVALHLSDDDGAPMHDVANGWYWYRRDLDTCARHLRVRVDEIPVDMDEESFSAYVDTLRPRWEREAKRALAIIRDEVGSHVCVNCRGLGSDSGPCYYCGRGDAVSV